MADTDEQAARRGPCQVIYVDGQPVRVQGTGKPLTPQDLAALREFIQYLRKLHLGDGGWPAVPHSPTAWSRVAA